MDVKKMKVSELRDALTERGIDHKSLKKKADLVKRLEEVLLEEGIDDDDIVDEEKIDIEADDTTTTTAATTTSGTTTTASSSSSNAAQTTVGLVGASSSSILQKKMERAAKFGTAVVITEEDKRRMRAERFGIPYTPPKASNKRTKNVAGNNNKKAKIAVSSDEAEKRLKRAQRFAQHQ